MLWLGIPSGARSRAVASLVLREDAVSVETDFGSSLDPSFFFTLPQHAVMNLSKNEARVPVCFGFFLQMSKGGSQGSEEFRIDCNGGRRIGDGGL